MKTTDDNSERIYLLHDAVAYLKSNSTDLLNVDLESIEHFFKNGELNISISVEHAIGRLSDREYRYAHEEGFSEGMEMPVQPSMEQVTFPSYITVDLLSKEHVFNLFRHDNFSLRYFIYEDKEYILESHTSKKPVITKIELDRFISGKSVVKKRTRPAGIFEKRLEALKEWMEKNTNSIDFKSVSLSRKDVWREAIGEHKGTDTINKFFTEVNLKEPELIKFKKGTRNKK